MRDSWGGPPDEASPPGGAATEIGDGWETDREHPWMEPNGLAAEPGYHRDEVAPPTRGIAVIVPEIRPVGVSA